MNKYKVRKLLTLLVILSIILGPIAFFKIEESIRIRPWVKMARAIEEYDSHIDVINILPAPDDPSWLDIIIQLDTKEYWTTLKWTSMVQHMLSLVNDSGYDKMHIYGGWEDGMVEFKIICEELRFDFCTPIMINPPQMVTLEFSPWIGKGKP